MSIEEQPLVYTVPEAARLLSISPSLLYHWISDGRWTRVLRWGRMVRIPRAAIEEFVRE